jgi:crotonobetainyl-CoA:carnitine CoA-transferase CaiB-like acyl-CoA transferase
VKPLDGIKVIACEHFIAGPLCTMILGDMGADVIKVEPPQGETSRSLGPPFLGGEAAYYLSFNRSKRDITIDTGTPEGIEILKKLIKGADVLVENYRVGVMEKMGLSYQEVSAFNPRLIYCSISGYGHDSPLRDKPGFDAMIQGESGFMDITGFPEGPPTRAGFALSDNVAGLYAVQGILLALMAREKTGRGQHIDIALIDSLVSFLTYQAGNYFASGESPHRLGNRHPVITPYEMFASKDGYFILAAGTQRLWERLCHEVLKLPELTKDPRFLTMADRNVNQPQLKAIIEELTVQKSTDEWIELLEAAGIPCGRIRTVGTVLEDENLKARGMVVEKQHPTAGKIRLLGNPVNLSDTPGEINLPPPLLGQHTEEILKELGYNDEEIKELKAKGIV